ncbi:hypothetical protein [Fusobacterium sp. PH5-44]|uniref:hypothetical protein n=1 Tax=unclassified Fusobacterium TaxID=2648384 RepID=UPI003D1F1DC4
MIEVIMFCNGIVFIIIFKNIIKLKYIDLSVFSVINFVIMNLGLFWFYKNQVTCIIKGDNLFNPSLHYMAFMFLSLIILLIIKRKKITLKWFIYTMLTVFNLGVFNIIFAILALTGILGIFPQ